MSSGFVLKDVKRNRKVSLPFIRTVAAPIAILVCALHLSTIFSALAFDPRARLFSPGVQSVITQFNTIVLVLLGILAAGVIIFATYAWIAHKNRDLVTMKAIGTLPARLYTYFVNEILLLTFLGYLLGLTIGSIAYGCIYLVLDSAGYVISFQFELTWNFVAFLLIMAVAYITGGQKIRHVAMELTVAQTYAGDVPFHTYTGKSLNPLFKFLYKLGTSVKIGTRNIIRRSHDFHRTFGVLTISGTLVLICTLGTIALSTSVQGYLRGSLSENTIAIGHISELPYVTRLYGQFADPSQIVYKGDVNFSTPAYFFPAANASAFANVAGVIGVDPRVCLLESFQEMPGITCDTSGTCSYLGQQRQGIAIVMGINSTAMQTNFFQMGQFVAPNDNTSVTIGDSIMYNYMDNYTEEQIIVHNHILKMGGVVEDSLYNGQSIYMGIGALWQFWPELNPTYNLLLVQVNSTQYDSVLASLNSLAQSKLGPAFGAVGLRETVRANEAALSGVNDYFMILDVAILGIACVTLIEYQRGASAMKAQDLFIMWSIGAKRGFLLKSIYWEIALLILPAVGFAMGISMLIVEFGFMS